MKKKKYEKPSMEVVLFSAQPCILAGSSTGNGGFGSYYPDYEPLP